jgi:hypothetical protein
MHGQSWLIRRRLDQERWIYSYNQFEKLFQDFPATKVLALTRNVFSVIESGVVDENRNMERFSVLFSSSYPIFIVILMLL